MSEDTTPACALCGLPDLSFGRFCSRRCAANSNRPSSHGDTIGRRVTPTYQSWVSSKNRITNPNNPAYPRYGGAGLTMDPRWLASYAEFLADMGPRPSRAYSIERRANSQGYWPDNCYWGSRTDQARNKKDNRLITFKDETKTLAEWSEILGIPYQALHARLDKLDWSVEKAFTTPSGSKTKHITANGMTGTIVEWSKISGISTSTIWKRLIAGWEENAAVLTPKGPSGPKPKN